MHKSVVVARAELVRETRSLPLLTDSIVILSGNNVHKWDCTVVFKSLNNFKT